MLDYEGKADVLAVGTLVAYKDDDQKDSEGKSIHFRTGHNLKLDRIAKTYEELE
jgi:hypothetical protein